MLQRFVLAEVVRLRSQSVNTLRFVLVRDLQSLINYAKIPTTSANVRVKERGVYTELKLAEQINI